MTSIIKNKEVKTSLLFTLIGLVATFVVVLYQIPLMSAEIKQEVINQMGSMEVMIMIAILQGGVLIFLAAFIGLKLASKVDFKLNFKFDQKTFVLSVGIAFLVALIIVGSDRLIFSNYMPGTSYNFSITYLALGLLYGGVVEEVLMRLFVMSLLVWGLKQLFSKSSDSKDIPVWIYWIAIVTSATIFAALHLPITFQTIGTSFPIILRCMLLNGIGGIGYGYLYWKKGLSYAIVAHAATHVFMQLVFMPILF